MDMDKGTDPRAAMLLGALFGMAPDRPGRGDRDPAGHECGECHGTQGHLEACVSNRIQKFVLHARDHPPCYRALKACGGKPENVENLQGLCPRGQRLFGRAKAVGEASDQAYEERMGGRTGKPRT
jgi:hypothetical protein